MTWWQDEIQQLRQENDQLRQQLANQPNFSQLIAQYLKEKELIQEATTQNAPDDYAQLLKFKAWVDERPMSSSNVIPSTTNRS